MDSRKSAPFPKSRLRADGTGTVPATFATKALGGRHSTHKRVRQCLLLPPQAMARQEHDADGEEGERARFRHRLRVSGQRRSEERCRARTHGQARSRRQRTGRSHVERARADERAAHVVVLAAEDQQARAVARERQRPPSAVIREVAGNPQDAARRFGDDQVPAGDLQRGGNRVRAAEHADRRRGGQRP